MVDMVDFPKVRITEGPKKWRVYSCGNRQCKHWNVSHIVEGVQTGNFYAWPRLWCECGCNPLCDVVDDEWWALHSLIHGPPASEVSDSVSQG
jgi:hypothetical protein